MIHQYHAQRSSRLYPKPVTIRIHRIAYFIDPRDKRVGTIPLGTILYIQDGSKATPRKSTAHCVSRAMDR